MKKILLTTALSLMLCHLAFADDSDRPWALVTGACDTVKGESPHECPQPALPLTLNENVDGRCESHQPSACIPASAGHIWVTNQDYANAFHAVNPDPNHHPSGSEQMANKDDIVSVLKQEFPTLNSVDPKVVNNWVDNAMDEARPEGPNGGNNPPSSATVNH